MSSLPKKVLIVDDDSSELATLEKHLSSQNIQVVKANDWSTALYQFNQHKFDLAIIELELENLLGTALIQKWRQHEVASKRDTAFIIAAGRNKTPADDALIKELGDVPVLIKPYKLPSILSAMNQAVNMTGQRNKLEDLDQRFLKPLLKLKKYKKVTTIAEEKVMPLGDRGKLLAASVFERSENIPRAITTTQELSDSDPNNMKYSNELGRLNMLLGDLEAARAAFEKADKAAPHNLNRLNEMAELYLRTKEPDKSITSFKQIINLTPEDTEIKYDMYQKLMSAGYEQQALKFCAETSTPLELIRHFNNKGVMYSKQNDYVAAIDEYEKAMKLIPGSKEIYRILYNMALAHINLKHYDHIQTAHSLLLRVLEIKPTYEKALVKIELTKKYIAMKSA